MLFNYGSFRQMTIVLWFFDVLELFQAHFGSWPRQTIHAYFTCSSLWYVLVFDLSITTNFIQPYLIQAWMKRNQGDLENFKYFSLSFVSILWSIWSYRNEASMKKEPFSATNVATYFISLILVYRVIVSSKIKEKPWQ